MSKAKLPFNPNLYVISARGGLHEMEESTLTGVYHPRSGGRSSRYYLKHWVKDWLPNLPQPATVEDMKAEMLRQFPHLKGRSASALEQHLGYPVSYMLTWGFLVRRADGLFAAHTDVDLSKFRDYSVYERWEKDQSSREAPANLRTLEGGIAKITERLGEIAQQRQQLDQEEAGLRHALSLLG